MILILSSSKDRTTQDVCKWLLHLNKKFLVLHEEDALKIEEITKDSIWLKVLDRNIVFNLEECTSYWYRRDNFSIVGGIETDNADLKKFVNTNINADLLTATQYLHFLLLKKNGIASIFNANVNKLNVIHLAKENGLLIPDFIYTGSKKKLETFMGKYDEIIYKTPSPAIRDTFENLSVSALTRLLTPTEFDALSDEFGLTFFQKRVQKKFEIRTFFLANKFYSLALISQKNEKTQVDYRNYDADFPNRNVPFRLDSETEEKIKKVILSLKLDTCSIDWMYTPEGELYFLEINPVGQFGNVSFHRNDNLPKEIALYLN